MIASSLFAFFFFFFFIASCFSEKAPYTSFAKNATFAPATEFFDYIVIGGGTAGCALAATLSAGAKVLLLERGGLPYGNPNITSINGFARTLADTSPDSASQLFVSSDGVFNHRARVLGGGSCLNAGFYTRASKAYVDNVGWDEALVNESYDWVERKVAFKPPMLAWQSAVRDGLIEAGVLPYNGFTYEHLYGTKVGGTIFDENGYRHTAADLLEYADPTKITVYLYATVHKIFFQKEEEPKAYAVLYKDSGGNRHIAYLNDGPKNEIILSAGALGSPQLLMLSGIGAAQQLKAHKIPVVMNQAMVGQGMSDNPMNAVFIPSPHPVEVSLIQVVGITKFDSYIEAASGSLELAWMHRMVSDFERLANQSSRHFLGGGNLSFFADAAVKRKSIKTYLGGGASVQAGIILEKVAGPYSTGNLELRSKDPSENPKVTFNYFKDPRDLQRCVEGIEIIAKVIESRPFSKFRYPLAHARALIDAMLTLPLNLRPKHVSATFSLEQFCKDTVMTIWHYHGGCQVNRVVDKDYKVIGVKALRVVDGSTFINSPGTNPQATVMMLGRYVGRKIMVDRAPLG
ncbi:protein HOTHEAD-like isoform X3 [Ipomoea triloba]|uniref:protein HOTHEAD-like isoform X3 n=1 Tax=Ipomoea triloba TaxID=35885 RepID=UPI00125D4DB8|nr:protein HOTHEAD-like isoform X3 [Ipomoea triloba]